MNFFVLNTKSIQSRVRTEATEDFLEFDFEFLVGDGFDAEFLVFVIHVVV